MKKLLLSIALVAAAMLPALGQYSIESTDLTGGTNNVATASTNSAVAITIPAVRANNLAVQTSFKLTGSGTSAVVLKFDSSVDGSTWETASFTQSVTPAGTSVVVGVDNFAVSGAGYLRLQTIENPNSAAVTNLTVKYGYKRGL